MLYADIFFKKYNLVLGILNSMLMIELINNKVDFKIDKLI